MQLLYIYISQNLILEQVLFDCTTQLSQPCPPCQWRRRRSLIDQDLWTIQAPKRDLKWQSQEDVGTSHILDLLFPLKGSCMWQYHICEHACEKTGHAEQVCMCTWFLVVSCSALIVSTYNCFLSPLLPLPLSLPSFKWYNQTPGKECTWTVFFCPQQTNSMKSCYVRSQVSKSSVICKAQQNYAAGHWTTEWRIM